LRDNEKYVLSREQINLNEYNRLKSDKNYIDVAYNKENGGLKATHIDHSFDPNKGKYEKEIQKIGFKHGNSVILGAEKGDPKGKRYADGLWNDKRFEVGTSLGEGKNNVKSILNHARDKWAKVAIVYFPNEKIYSYERLQNGVKKYNGQTNYRFEQIIYIVNENIFIYQ